MATGPRGLPIDFQWYPEPVVLADELDRGAVALHDMNVPLAESIPLITANVESRFESGGDGEWQPWAVEGEEGPVKAYQQDYRGYRLLDRTGDMKGHATSESSYAIVGNTIQYVPSGIKDEIFHSEGPYLRNIWERPFIGLNEAGIDEVEGVFAKWISSILAGTAAKRGTESLAGVEAFSKSGKFIGFRGPGGRFVSRG